MVELSYLDDGCYDELDEHAVDPRRSVNRQSVNRSKL